MEILKRTEMVKYLRWYILSKCLSMIKTLVAETRPFPHSVRQGCCPDAGRISLKCWGKGDHILTRTDFRNMCRSRRLLSHPWWQRPTQRWHRNLQPAPHSKKTSSKDHSNPCWWIRDDVRFNSEKLAKANLEGIKTQRVSSHVITFDSQLYFRKASSCWELFKS